jgi:hypothetical protein
MDEKRDSSSTTGNSYRVLNTRRISAYILMTSTSGLCPSVTVVEDVLIPISIRYQNEIPVMHTQGLAHAESVLGCGL